MDKGRVIGLIIVIVFIGFIIYFLFSPKPQPYEIPTYVSGEKREIYEWAITDKGKEVLEQMPCYCGCKFAGHRHSRDCFWTDENMFDNHGMTCSVCFNIGKRSKEMYEQGKDVCEIRKTIDKFYEVHKRLATDTPMPKGCE